MSWVINHNQARCLIYLKCTTYGFHPSQLEKDIIFVLLNFVLLGIQSSQSSPFVLEVDLKISNRLLGLVEFLDFFSPFNP